MGIETVSQQLPSRKNKKPNKKSFGWKILLWFVLLALVGVLVYAGYLYLKFEDALGEVAGSEDVVPAEQSAKNKSQSILLLGLDNRKQTGSLNTDVIMVATLNPERQSTTVVSIPRDTYIKPEGYRARKANGFFAVTMNEDKETAYSEIKKIFGDFLDIQIDYVVVINFKTFEDIIDAIDGIHVDVDMDMRYVDNADGTNINLSKGYQKLDGKNALDFIRYRTSNMGTAESSDLQRNERQLKVISAAVDELKSFNGVLKLGEIFEAVGANIDSDIPKSQIKNFIFAYAGISNKDIQTLPLEGVWKSPFVYPNEDSYETVKQKLKEQLQ